MSRNNDDLSGLCRKGKSDYLSIQDTVNEEKKNLMKITNEFKNGKYSEKNTRIKEEYGKI